MAPKRGPNVDEETATKAAADLAAGMTVDEVAKKYDLARSTAGDRAITSKRGAAKIRKIADLTELQRVFLEQLAHNFAALRSLTDLIRTDAAFAAEHGHDLAYLYAVVFDKTGKLAGAAVARGTGVDAPALPDTGSSELEPAPAVANDCEG